MRYCIVPAIIMCGLVFSGCGEKTVEPPVAEPVYKLVWSDEFNYTGLPDPDNWDYETGKIRNNETQFYVAGNLENSKVENGFLTIRATLDNSRTNPVTSASVITKNKVDFLYGKIEARVKMPTGKGAWPAVWTVGKNRETIGWPMCGEIDIMEWLGFLPQFVFGSLHKGNTQKVDAPLIGPYQVPTADLSDKFHIYSIIWDKTSIKFYFDDNNYVTYTADQMSADEWAQFTKPHYLLLNLAMGGTSGGAIDNTKYPFEYSIDYVRYYVKGN